MKKLKLSHWHSKKSKPVHAGVYQTRFGSLSEYRPQKYGYSYFDGEAWGSEFYYLELADRKRERGWQAKQWRGIVK